MVLLVGNWKTAPEKISEASSLARTALALSKKYKKQLEIVVCPSFVHLASVLKTSKALKVGAQSAAPSFDLAQTGLCSAGQLRSLGVSYVIVGHSESRARGESNALTAEIVARVFEKKLTPIVCVGERERDAHGWYLSEVKDQIETALAGISKASLKQLVIAYEPVWAIGAHATREATPLESLEMIIYIRKIITDMFGSKAGDSVRILYGGSVNEKNAKQFITEGGAEGLLVGRVSLDAKRFAALAGSLIK